jgi:pyridoxine kinase
LTGLCALGAKNVILTGISYVEGKTGVVVYESGKYAYYEHEKMAKGSHGTGDIYASAFVGALVRGKSAYDAARIAADFTLHCIEQTVGDATAHWYGLRFEAGLPGLMAKLDQN